MKKLLAPLLLCASCMALGQDVSTSTPEYDLRYHIFWNFDVPVTLNYSTLDAPPSAPRDLVLKALGRVEARFNNLNIPGLSVRIGRTDLAVSCDYHTRNEVTICWENRQGETSNYQTYNRTDDVNYWHEGTIVMGKNTVWDEALLYEWLTHHVMHMVGFSHPNAAGDAGRSVLHGAPDLTQMDIDSLRHKYRADRCALTYDASGRIDLPFVKYMGGGFFGTLQHDGGASFSLVPGSLGRFGSQAFNVPAMIDPSVAIRIPVYAPPTPCPALEIDGNNELFLPDVYVGGARYQGTMKLANGKFTLISKAPK